MQIFPDPTRQYVVIVRGYVIPLGKTNFDAAEQLEFDTENYPVRISREGSSFQVDYALDSDALASSVLSTLPEFTSGRYSLFGELSLKTSNGFRVANLPVRLVARDSH